MTRNVVPIGISIPSEMLREIDKLRGDVTRSRYIMRILERYYSDNRVAVRDKKK